MIVIGKINRNFLWTDELKKCLLKMKNFIMRIIKNDYKMYDYGSLKNHEMRHT